MFHRDHSEPQVTEVSMYTLSTCPWCRRAKTFFNDHQIPFEFTDVDELDDEQREEVAARVMELCGALQYPVVVINGDPIQGYDPDGYASRLRTLGWDV